MDNITHIGLDVHKDTIAVATLRPGSTTCEERVIPNTPEAIRRWASRLGDPAGLRLCYEAGPTGYDTHRLLTSLGLSCDVIAPALVPRRPGVRQKTDRSDARNLARFHRAGELIPIRVPSPAEEALRELIRAREDLKNDRRIARQRIRSFLLRHGRRPPAGATSRTAFAAWARTQHFEEPAAEAAFSHLLAAEEVRSGDLPGGSATGPGPRGGTLALFPRHRHPLGGHACRRGGRLSPLRFGRRLHGVHRSGAERALKRAFRPSWRHHEDRQRPS
jgi:hypothetical protein